jgi:hypothetical protein
MAIDINIESQVSQTITDGVTNKAPSENAVFDALATKVDKETGKGLSDENYTLNEKNKLAAIESGAEVNVNADWNATSGDAQILNKPTIPTVITNHSGLNLDDGTNPHGTTKTDIGLSNVNNTSDADKPISTATQTALNLKADISDISAVGFSNDYEDLDNKPTIPTVVTEHSELILNDGTNPHGTTKTDVGLSNVPNLDTTNAVNKAHDAVTLTGTPNYLTLVGQVITRGLIDLANHVTGRLGFSNLPTGTARSIVGRSGSGNGDLGNISAGNNTILGRSGSGNVEFNSAIETKQMLSLDNVDNTTDANKPISSATQTALDLKADITSISTVGFSNDYDDLDNLPDLKLATFTIELLNLLSVDFYAPNDLKINTTTVINGSGVVSVQVNDSAYTLGTVINQGDKITVSVDTASVVNLNSRYE